ncbi:hypothetical protein HanIR_Chr04g0155291 [Helianthus annuus]|uniref:Uncharacterized protein n=1 Tax=Helianthus annuus TaxID=4232 RepID=A0A251UV33_HELAN|nr:hypothetical protein HanIR_Chr04g0155291 [Helianthus annuus]
MQPLHLMPPASLKLISHKHQSHFPFHASALYQKKKSKLIRTMICNIFNCSK